MTRQMNHDFLFQTIKRSDRDYRGLMLNMPALLFMGGMAKAISI
jgi:hypothetical protein